MSLIRSKTQPSLYQVKMMTIKEYIQEHQEWSLKTFGEGNHTEGLLKHIEKEVEEVRRFPHNLLEWMDIIILAFDGAGREGYTPEQIASALIEKQNINRGREWPKITDASQPTEHVRKESNGQNADG